MLKTLQNWMMNVAAVFIWKAIMFPIRVILGLCFAPAKYMPEKGEIPYKVVKKTNSLNTLERSVLCLNLIINFQ